MKKVIYISAVVILTMCATITLFAQDMTTSNMKTGMKANPDSKFMMTLATGGANEIGLSQTALAKFTNDDIKQFAQKMVDDHTAAGDELKTLASSKSVSLPTAMDVRHMTLNTKLSGMSSSAFDMEYTKAMVKDHEDTVSLLQKEIK